VQGAHVFRAELIGSEAGLALSEAPRRFSLPLRRRGPCLVASPDAAEGSLRIRPDVRVYSALLAPGRHAVHPLLAGRVAWLHLVRGAATLDGIGLRSGDGAEIEGERSVSLTARSQTEILLFDLDGSELPMAGGAGA
jgi:redox-sensitive bicupin YhaK (pirin superfamily)